MASKPLNLVHPSDAHTENVVAHLKAYIVDGKKTGKFNTYCICISDIAAFIFLSLFFVHSKLYCITFIFKVLRSSGLMKEISTNSVSIRKLNG